MQHLKSDFLLAVEKEMSKLKASFGLELKIISLS